MVHCWWWHSADDLHLVFRRWKTLETVFEVLGFRHHLWQYWVTRAMSAVTVYSSLVKVCGTVDVISINKLMAENVGQVISTLTPVTDNTDLPVWMISWLKSWMATWEWLSTRDFLSSSISTMWMLVCHSNRDNQWLCRLLSDFLELMWYIAKFFFLQNQDSLRPNWSLAICSQYELVIIACLQLFAWKGSKALIDLQNRNDESYVLVYSALAFVCEQAQI